MGIGPLKFEQRPVHNLLNNFPSLSFSLPSGIILIPAAAFSFPAIARYTVFLAGALPLPVVSAMADAGVPSEYRPRGR